jgi:cyclopropane-fatty-acyl-phospholipid synthase
MSAAFSWFLRRFIRMGALSVRFADGSTSHFGDGSGAEIAIALKDAAAETALLAHPDLKLGELYMDGRLTIERGDVYELIALAARNFAAVQLPGPVRAVESLREAASRYTPVNDRWRSRRNVAHHYDLDERLYRLFLDTDLQYSCAYFERWDVGLDEAQLAKKRHIAAKLMIAPGQTVLDIGCGFGGMAIYLARNLGAKVTGVTLSTEQLSVARRRVEEAGLSDRVSIRLQDYRDVEGTFDRVVSVGMFEHVGRAGFDEYFAHARRLLKEDGVMLLHAIGRQGRTAPTSPFIAKYIFPGGYLPPVSEVVDSVERNGLLTTDLEILRLHYAQTLRHWRTRFMARRDEALALYDERFCRMWEYYLAAAEAGFRELNLMVFHFQLARKQTAVPMTRDYLGAAESALRLAEYDRSAPLLAAE